MVRSRTWVLAVAATACSVAGVEPQPHGGGTSTGGLSPHGTTRSETDGTTRPPMTTGGSTSSAEGGAFTDSGSGTEATASTSTAGPRDETGEESSESTSSSSVCDELYGNAPDYVLCWETDATCAFNALTAGDNCDAMCSMFGGTCVDAHDNPNDPGTECRILQDEDDCSTNRTTEICECSK